MSRKKKAKAGDPAFAPVPNGQPVSKVEKNGWVIIDKPGRAARIEKHLLNIDHEYQRTRVSWPKVNAMAAEWSWAACLSLGVAEREDGTLWVFDGQHRKLAADKRADVFRLPCLIFPSTGQTDEAKAFLSANCARGPVRTLDKFNALVMAKDTAAVRVRDLVEASGYRVGVANGKRTRVVECVQAIMRAVTADEASAVTAWELCVELFHGESVLNEVYSGLAYLEGFLRRKEAGSLTERHNRTALLRIGVERLQSNIAKAKAMYGGGAKSSAEGIVAELNKGRRTNALPHPFGDR